MQVDSNEQTREEYESQKDVTLWQFWTQIPIQLQRQSITFIVINLCDIIMTWYLLTSQPVEHIPGHQTSFYESNPIAGFILDHWGVRGMIYFKAIVVAVVILITQFIARQRLKWARFLLNFGSVVVLCVVFYSLWLLMKHAGPVAV
ncbi:MAG: DUF5658 family protein [Planctomycetaceae bacterium]